MTITRIVASKCTSAATVKSGAAEVLKLLFIKLTSLVIIKANNKYTNSAPSTKYLIICINPPNVKKFARVSGVMVA